MTDNQRPLPRGATPGQLEMFLELLSDIGATVVSCARAAGISKRIVYELRRTDPRFAHLWQLAVEERCYRAMDSYGTGAISSRRMLNVIKSTKSVLARLKRPSRPSALRRPAPRRPAPDPADSAITERFIAEKRAIELEVQARAAYREQQDRLDREQRDAEARAQQVRSFFSGDDLL